MMMRAQVEIGPGRRPWESGLAMTTALLAAFVLLLACGEGKAAASCSNEDVRVQQSATSIPRCRAFEMVTPAAKGSGEAALPTFGRLVTTPVEGARASFDGERLAWVSQPVPGALAPGANLLAVRDQIGWSSQDLVPPMSPFNDLGCPVEMGVSSWSADLKRLILDLPAGPPAANSASPVGMKEERECGHDEPRLVPSEPEHFRNLFFHDTHTDTYQLVNITPSDVVWPEPEELLQRYFPASYLAGSDDLTHVVFEEELSLTPDAPIGYRGGDELYEWVSGQVRLVTILPDGTPVHGSLAGATRNYSLTRNLPPDPGADAVNVAQFRHAISKDGSRILFKAEGALYLRENGAITHQVDETHGPDPSGGGEFMIASADGSRVFFTADRRLTSDSTAAPGEPDLYEYRLQPGGPSVLSDLTVSASAPADVLGVSEASQDGSVVYFVARGALSSEPNSQGALPIAGDANLYLFREGVTTFVATLDPVYDSCDWKNGASCGGPAVPLLGPGLTARISNNGEFLAFNSVRSLTGYDNLDPKTGEPLNEIFFFDARSEQLSCASCPASGTPAIGGAAIHWPAPSGSNGNMLNAYPQRQVSDLGQVFFESVDALVPRDSNGVRDVYEYFDGSLHLLSTGRGESDFTFVDATSDGDDVFIATAQRLVYRDVDTINDYYDVRVDGGFLEPPPPARGCEEAGACRLPVSAAPGLQAGTNKLAGPGNVRHRRKKCRGRRHKHRHSHQGGKRTASTPVKGSASAFKARSCKRSAGHRGAAK